MEVNCGSRAVQNVSWSTVSKNKEAHKSGGAWQPPANRLLQALAASSVSPASQSPPKCTNPTYMLPNHRASTTGPRSRSFFYILFSSTLHNKEDWNYTLLEMHAWNLNIVSLLVWWAHSIYDFLWDVFFSFYHIPRATHVFIKWQCGHIIFYRIYSFVSTQDLDLTKDEDPDKGIYFLIWIFQIKITRWQSILLHPLRPWIQS